MGEVRSAHDPRLGRDVAIKTVAPGDARSAARLAREAALTARLEHPGIMPVYEAGRGEDGRPWYAMRLFTGSTLGESITQAHSLPERLRLVRHVLDAAQAVAYAHRQGILHRDLKPANVLTGAFGETIVADWGLATAIDEMTAAEPGIGTTGYMSPEQESGLNVDARTDVYALGAVLAEVLTGVPPAENPAAAVRELRGVPAELVAITERALQRQPQRRYASAGAFADDLLAWFEGRRVRAHEYSTSELVQRLVQRWRLPLIVAGVGLFAVGAALGWGWWTTSEERARAEWSAADAAVARAEEARAFAAALRVQARIAAADGFPLDAEVLAAQALRRDENADARGVLSAVYGRSRWTRLSRSGPRNCIRRAISQSAKRVICIQADGLKVVDVESGATVGARGGDWVRGAFSGDERHIMLMDREFALFGWVLGRDPVPVPVAGSRSAPFGRSFRPGQQSLRTGMTDTEVSVATGAFVERRTCGSASLQASSIMTSGALLVGCDDQRILSRFGDDPPRVLATLDVADGTPSLVQDVGLGRVLVGTVSGHAFIYNQAGELLLRNHLGDEAIQVAEPRADRIAIGIASGEVALWDLAANVVQARFRAMGLQVAWADDARIRLFGREVETRVVPAETRPHRLVVGAGVAVVTYSPDGKWLAVGDGSGTITLFDPRSGRVGLRLDNERAVAKDLGFSPDGLQLAVASAGRLQQVYGLPEGNVLHAYSGHPARRTVWFRKGGLYFMPYSSALHRVPGPTAGTPSIVVSQGFSDAEVSVDGSVVAALSPDDQVWVGRDAETPTWTPVVDAPWANGVAATTDSVFVIGESSLSQYSLAGELEWKAAIPRDSLDLAVSADGRWAAVGLLDGSIQVFAVGEAAPRARMTGHRARVGALAFSPDGEWLASGGWDKEVRIWSVAAFEADASTTADEVERAWGRTLDEVLNPPAIVDGR